MPILKKPGNAGKPNTPTAKAPVKEKADDVPMKHNTDKKGSGDAFASRFNSSDGKAAFVPPEPGQYNALITEIQASRDEEGVKETVFFECTITDDSEPGKTCRIYFNFTDEEGKEGTGMPYFKFALKMLGFDDQLTSWDQMVDLCAEIAEQQPWIILDVKKNGKYTNYSLNSVPDDQDSKPALPE